MEVLSMEKVRSRVEVVFDEEKVSISAAMLREWPLEIGQEVDREAYEQFLLRHQYKPCLEYAVTLLTARAYAEKELAEKLLRAGYHRKTAEIVLYKLQKSHILDDADYAKTYARNRSENRVGSFRIAQELRRKGVDPDTIQDALSEMDEDAQLEQATELAVRQLKQIRTDEDPRKTVQKLVSKLVRRGYSFELARKAVRQALSKRDL